MNSDIIVYCDNQNGTSINFDQFPNYPKFRWFWERLNPNFTDSTFVDSTTPTVWWEEPLIEPTSQVIKKVVSRTDGVNSKVTCVKIVNFLGYEWEDYWKQYLPRSQNSKPVDELNYIYFKKFYDFVKECVPKDGVLYFFWNV